MTHHNDSIESDECLQPGLRARGPFDRALNWTCSLGPAQAIARIPRDIEHLERTTGKIVTGYTVAPDGTVTYTLGGAANTKPTTSDRSELEAARPHDAGEGARQTESDNAGSFSFDDWVEAESSKDPCFFQDLLDANGWQLADENPFSVSVMEREIEREKARALPKPKPPRQPRVKTLVERGKKAGATFVVAKDGVTYGVPSTGNAADGTQQQLSDTDREWAEFEARHGKT